MATSFAAQVSEWARKSEARLEAVHKRSIELLADEMSTTVRNGGRVPFDVGNLYKSLLASTSAMPKTASGPFSGSNVGAVVAQLRPDQAIYLGYQAAYARRQNFGFVGQDSKGRSYNQSGFHFVEYAISMWPTIVQLASEDLEAAVAARKS